MQIERLMQPEPARVYPPGKYYVGDLCYFKAIDWGEFCRKTIVDRKCLYGDFEVSGRTTWHHGTKHGDGCFESNTTQYFAVDAGLIGICPVVEGDVLPKGSEWLVYEFKESFTPKYEDGTFYIGDLIIYTGHSSRSSNDEDDAE